MCYQNYGIDDIHCDSKDKLEMWKFQFCPWCGELSLPWRHSLIHSTLCLCLYVISTHLIINIITLETLSYQSTSYTITHRSMHYSNLRESSDYAITLCFCVVGKSLNEDNGKKMWWTRVHPVHHEVTKWCWVCHLWYEKKCFLPFFEAGPCVYLERRLRLVSQIDDIQQFMS